MVPILYWVKRQRARHELGVAKGSVVWDRPGGERGAGPETDVTTISRITRPHVSGRDFQRDRLAQAASCSSDSRAGDPAQSGEANPSDSPTGINLRRVGRGRIGTHPFVSPKPPCRPAHGLEHDPAAAARRRAQPPVPGVGRPPPRLCSGFRSVSDSATRADRNLALAARRD
jgi:hypothetical protein